MPAFRDEAGGPAPATAAPELTTKVQDLEKKVQELLTFNQLLVDEKRKERVKRQEADFKLVAKQSGVPDDLLDDAWAMAVALRKADPKQAQVMTVSDVLEKVREKRPSYFRTQAAAPAAPAAKPAPAKPDPVRPRAPWPACRPCRRRMRS